MEKFEFLAGELSTTTTDKVETFVSIAKLLSADGSEDLTEQVKSSKIIHHLANVLREHKHWANSMPEWICAIISQVFTSSSVEIPTEEVKSLVESLKEYLSIHKSEVTVEMLGRIVSKNRLPLLEDESLLNIIKGIVRGENKAVATFAIMFLMSATDNCLEWQLAILQDTQLILDLLTFDSSNEDVWGLLANISTHPDAKVLLPSEVLEQASKSSIEACTDICAILCSEATANSLKLPKLYIEGKAESLKELLGIKTKVNEFFRYSLMDLVLPLVNLSIADANKEVLGQCMIELLLQVVGLEEDKPLIANIAECLTRAKQEATKTLWNLAFTEKNRENIKAANGLTILKQTRAQTKDTILQKNITGILYMFGKHEKSHTEPSSRKKHVMISYNWTHQPTILRLAESLKQNGYKIWLDVEQMEGSTLEAMAGAIEQAELVLICMSQKYKDSPNCRLEGEYCVNSKVTYIPLMMQQNYKPDGWLGLALGSKLWYAFWDENDWDSKIASLIKAMGGLSRSKTNQMSTELRASTSSITLTDVREWKEKEILVWMKAEGIEHHKDIFQQQKLMNGKALAELKVLLFASQPLSSLLSFFREWFGINELGEMMLVISALRKL